MNWWGYGREWRETVGEASWEAIAVVLVGANGDLGSTNGGGANGEKWVTSRAMRQIARMRWGEQEEKSIGMSFRFLDVNGSGTIT